ncbi:EF-hand domain-containing family member C2-like [Stegodyphus dumicola]|uniref:EF-hand domain-containing family member C2-like n=1 Tax=Stegodyphus dumicola TaxID=202533 RepID=UPI0015AEEF60|nr:EF-hand domain-containing family member C2-like [Stegodyphus dumicola]
MSYEADFSVIPGFSASSSLNKTSYNKPQRFIVRNGLRWEEDESVKAPKLSKASHLLGSRNIDKEPHSPILKFNAYYCEKLGEDPESATRFRKCNVLYYIDDDDIKVYEPRQINSGCPQGCIVAKGRFQKPDGTYYCIDDLNIGKTLVLNGREYKLINCDDFTRNFLTEMGYKVPPRLPDVIDPITEDREERNKLRSYRKPTGKTYKLAPFLKNHPKRLRFFGYYGEEKNLFEEKREITLYYNLADGLIKIVEERCKNKWIDGRFDTRVILRPTLVPKNVDPALPIGEMADPTLLNLAHDVENVLIGGKYYKIQKPTSVLVDSNPLEGRRRFVEYYTDKDLDLGVEYNIFGSKVVLHDCDEFTKNYYRATYNKELIPVPRPEIPLFKTHKLVYKHEEFGSSEQTIRTNDPFTPKPLEEHLLKVFEKDRFAYEVRELKFLARIVTDNPVEKDRRFTVRWYMEDDTMDIRALDLDFERASIMEHVHFRRMRVTKPHAHLSNFEPCFYQPADMYVGNVIYVRTRPFKLLEADEYTYNYMENYCNQFKYSNIKTIMAGFREWMKQKVESLKSTFQEKDPNYTGFISYEDFKDVLYAEMPEEIREKYPEHAIKTLARYYADEEDIGLKLDDLISRVKTELYWKKYYDFEDLKLAFRLQDEDKTGYLDPKRVYFVFRSCLVPINRDLLKSFIYKFPKVDGKIKFDDMIDAMNWAENPDVYHKPEPHAVKINWERIETKKNLQKIKYNLFLMNTIM